MYIAMYLAEANAENWDLLLQHAAWVHNSSTHESLGTSPFEIVTGIKPRVAKALLPEIPGMNTRDLEEDSRQIQEYYQVHAEQLHELRKLAQEAIAKAQAVTIERLNKHTRVPTFRPGQKVLKRRHLYRRFVDRKWNQKFDGPYTVIEIISPTVYKIQLDSQPTYRDVVHSSYLRPYRVRTTNPPQAVMPAHPVAARFPTLEIEDAEVLEENVPEHEATLDPRASISSDTSFQSISQASDASTNEPIDRSTWFADLWKSVLTGSSSDEESTSPENASGSLEPTHTSTPLPTQRPTDAIAMRSRQPSTTTGTWARVRDTPDGPMRLIKVDPGRRVPSQRPAALVAKRKLNQKE
jgi:hypothetical protein